MARHNQNRYDFINIQYFPKDIKTKIFVQNIDILLGIESFNFNMNI